MTITFHRTYPVTVDYFSGIRGFLPQKNATTVFTLAALCGF